MTTEFRSYQRPGVHRTATPPPAGGRRLTGHLKLRVADDIGKVANPDIPFALAGPADVVGFESKAVVKRYPAPGVADAETTKAPYIELTPADLPWRYSASVPQAGGLRPWLVLVVGPAATMNIDGRGRVTLPGAVTALHPLAMSAGWAHVHRPASGAIGRLLSPQTLAPGVLHLAVLVPAYRLDAGQLVDSWVPNATSAPLPVFDSWSFTTVTNADDFTSIARRLEPLSAQEWARLRGLNFGTASVRYRLPRPAPQVELPTGAALTLVPQPGAPPVDSTAGDPTVLTDLGALAKAARVHAGRWVLGMPDYAEPWPFPPGAAPPAGARGWAEELTDDPRRRGVAGLGAWIAIEWQDRIADAAADQAGAVAAAAERVRHLVLGLSASRSLWSRRVPKDPLAQLWLFGPTLAKLPADTGGSVLTALSARVPSLAAVRSGAARRALRRGSTAARLASPGAVDPVALLVAANRCPPRPPQAGADVGPRVDDWLAGAEPQDGYAQLADPLDSTRLHGFFDYDPVDPPELGPEAVDDLHRRLRIEGPPPDDCRPLDDLDALGGLVGGACSPMVPEPAALVRVRATVHGLPEPWLKPPDLTPELDLPLSVFLTERAPDWLMPGVGDLPMDRAVGTASNPVFIESLLVGANHRATGELRWRNLPVVTGWTPLRRFWNRIGKAGTANEGPLTDIDGIVDIAKLRANASDWLRWPAGSRLGDPSHLPDPTRGANFVVLLHTTLFHRYPATVCRLVVARKVGGTPNWNVDPDPTLALDPTFKGHIGPDVTFFGFPVDPQAGRGHWVVIEESPPGYRFWSPTQNGTPAWGADGGVVAQKGLVQPVRVLLGRLVEDNG